MRRLWLLISFLSFSAFADDGVRCSNLRKHAQELEKKIQNQKLSKESGECLKIPLSDLGIAESKLTFKDIIPSKADGSANYDYRCKDYSAVEAQLKLVENELALLNGIKSLKLEIEEGIKTLKGFKENPAVQATKELFKNLEIAKSLELFFATNNEKSENILHVLAKEDKKWDTKNKATFEAHIKKFCETNSPVGDTVCNSGLPVSDEVFNELNDLIGIGKNTEGKFKPKHIKELSEALEISKDNKKYSFTDLMNEVKNPGRDKVLPEEELKKLQAINLNPESDVSFLKKIAESQKTIKDSKPLTDAQALPQKYNQFLEDLKKRHIWEMKSKLSLVFHQFPDKQCEIGESGLPTSVGECLDKFINSGASTGSNQDSNDNIIQDLKNELVISESYIHKINSVITACSEKTTLEELKNCDQGLITSNEAELLEKSKYLNAIKTKMLENSAQDIVLRNFALEQLHSSECNEIKEDTSINNCSADLGDMAKEAVALSKNASDIVFVLQNPKNQTNIDEICNKETSTTSVTANICALRPQKKDEEKKVNPDFFQASVDPETRNRGAEDFSNFARSALSSLATALTPPPKPMNQPNPYQQNYPMVPPTAGKHIVSQVLEPALYTGYGQYRSHPGLTGYAPSGPSGRAAPYTFSTSSYFNYPVGQ